MYSDDIQWHASQTNLPASHQATILYKEFENYVIKLLSQGPMTLYHSSYHRQWACFLFF